MCIKVIIPARKGSKGLPGKNIKILNNKPLIDYSIETALNIVDPDSIFVTSDSEEILERGKIFGVKTLLRPEELAQDESPILETIFHTVNYFEKDLRKEIKQILLLQPTFPIRNVLEINNALKLFKNKKLSSLVSVTKMREHPCECITISNKVSKEWNFLVNPLKETNRQSYFGSHFFIDGNFYIAEIQSLKNFNSFFFNKTYFFECQNKFAIDIDNIEDFEYAEYCLSKQNNNKK